LPSNPSLILCVKNIQERSPAGIKGTIIVPDPNAVALPAAALRLAKKNGM
jgi:hypothetical protein